MEMGGKVGDLAAYPREREWAPIFQEIEWVAGPGWTVVEQLALTTDPSPDRPGRSESLYRLSCPGQITLCINIQYKNLQVITDSRILFLGKQVF
jgi:hypothetical protein